MNGIVEGLGDSQLFRIESVQLQFRVANLVALCVSNNVLVMAVAGSRLLRIDLNNPQNVDDIDLSKKAETGSIKGLWLDPTGNHLLATTSGGEAYYVHSKWTKAKPLSRLKNLHIKAVAWSESSSSPSSKEILAGTEDGSIYEFSIQPADEYFKREERYFKLVHSIEQSITGIFAGSISNKPDGRRVLISTANRLYHFTGRLGKAASETSPLYAHFFTSATMIYREFSAPSQPIPLAISPPLESGERHFAWLSGSGLYHGKLLTASEFDLGEATFSEAQIIPLTQFSNEPVKHLLLTRYHVVCMCGSHIYAVNLLTNETVFREKVTAVQGETILSFLADLQQSTYWFFTPSKIFEIVAENEDRDIWKIMLQRRSYDVALQLAKTHAQKDAVNIAAADHLVQRSQYVEAAGLYGKSTKSFEEVTLLFLDRGESEALLKYLQSKLSHLRRNMYTQRTMLASWVVELFMAKLNAKDDVAAQAQGDTIDEVRESYQQFVEKFKSDLHKGTVYEIISAHGRQQELLYYASSIGDQQYVLEYWVNKQCWDEALAVLNKQHDPEVFYKHASVLLLNRPRETIDVWIRHTLDPVRLISALLQYSRQAKASIGEHQAIRYLLFVVNHLGNRDTAIHNALISIYATHPSRDESGLLHYLEIFDKEPPYDADFALRLCVENDRLQSCVHIYSSMRRYDGAVQLALERDDVELASIVANRPDDDALRKKLWLRIAEKVISTSSSIKDAVQFLKRCELLKIEDLIPLFPDFTVIDDFKSEICSALEEYTQHIDTLKRDMDDAAQTAATIDRDIENVRKRYAIVEAGERCFICLYPLLSRQFYVFPCQHTFHADCLTKRVLKTTTKKRKQRILELQGQLHTNDRREEGREEFDELVAFECALCGEAMIQSISQPFVENRDSELESWKIS